MGIKESEEHSSFLAEYAAELGNLFEVASSDIDRHSMFIEWFAEKVFNHGYKHGLEDAVTKITDGFIVKPGGVAEEYPKDGRWVKCGSDGWKMKDGFTKDGFPRNNEEHVRQMYEAGP